MIIIKFHDADKDLMNKINYDINLSLVGSNAFIENEISVSPVHYQNDQYGFEIYLGDEGSTNMAIDMGCASIDVYRMK